uniref:Ig-like domain-containing protein n=1 Tax=Sinocyclocheilus grahami TaxID=75366 RepID=A0A672LCH0_SINGR
MVLLLHFLCLMETWPLLIYFLYLILFLMTCICPGVWANKVVVPEQVTEVLGKSITLTCRGEVSTNLSLTQTSWERQLPSGTITLAVFNPQYGTSIADEYSKRVHFIKPSVHDVSMVLQSVGFADTGTCTCKVVTFQLGIMQASTTVDIMGEYIFEMDTPNSYFIPAKRAIFLTSFLFNVKRLIILISVHVLHNLSLIIYLPIFNICLYLALSELPLTAAAHTTTITTKTILPDTSLTITAPINQCAHSTEPTQASPLDSSLGTIVGAAVDGFLMLVLLMALARAFYLRQCHTFRGVYYTKQYTCPSDMQKESQLHVLQPHELQDVYGDDSEALKLKPKGDIINPNYPNDHKDMEGCGDKLSLQREGTHYSDHHNPHNMNPSGPLLHNGSPYLQEKCYNGTDSDYVFHMDGSVISRRELFV